MSGENLRIGYNSLWRLSLTNVKFLLSAMLKIWSVSHNLMMLHSNTNRYYVTYYKMSGETLERG